MRRGREDGVQAKRLRAQAEKDKQEALKALEAKKRRLAQERAISDEAKKEAKKRLEYERDRATNQYYEVTGGSSDPPASSRQRSKGLPGSVSRESGRASAAAPKSKETPPPEVEEQYPGWDRGDGNVPQDLDERAIPFVRRTEDDEDRGSGGSVGEKLGTDDDEELEDERFRIGIGRRGPRHEPEQPLALARAGPGRAAGGGALVVAADVDERFVMPPGRALETSVERAMAVVAMIGWGKDCDPYPKPETLMKYRAMIEGMPEYELDGSPSDPKKFLGEANYKYLMHWHTKKMSSTRGEFAGVKGVRGIFAQHEHFNMDLCKSDQQTAEMKAKGEELLKEGKWHTDSSGNPFSSETFKVIVNNVWRTEGCLITAKQLVWTYVVVDKMLQDKKLSIDRDVNARLLDTVGVEVGKIMAAAKKAKKTLGVEIRKIDTNINLATATMAYIKTGGGKKKGKKSARVEVDREPAAFWDNFGESDGEGEA